MFIFLSSFFLITLELSDKAGRFLIIFWLAFRMQVVNTISTVYLFVHGKKNVKQKAAQHLYARPIVLFLVVFPIPHISIEHHDKAHISLIVRCCTEILCESLWINTVALGQD